jgi:hypothetical protein
MNEGFDYELILEPTCAKVGQQFTATMRLRAGSVSGGTFLPIYADGSSEKGGGVIAEEDGTARYSWTAKDVPGEGRLVTQARYMDSDKSGTKIVAFRIAEVAEPC